MISDQYLCSGVSQHLGEALKELVHVQGCSVPHERGNACLMCVSGECVHVAGSYGMPESYDHWASVSHVSRSNLCT